jgi:glycosyltransferase involved in cell wall biosynthesis
MRILMVVPKYPFPVMGGLERQAHELAKMLFERGHAVHALSTRFDAGQKSVELNDGVLVHRVAWLAFRPLRFFLLPFSLARAIYRLRRDVDIVHLHNISWLGAFVTVFAKTLGLPVMTKLPSIGSHGGHGGVPSLQKKPLGFLRIALLKRSDVIIAMTPESVKELACIGYPSTRTLKVTNGIPLLPDMLPLPPSSSAAINVVFVGRLFAQKGLVDLIQAWRKVRARATHPPKLRLLGDGPQKKELQALAKAINLGESIEFLGHCENVPAELNKADVFVLPSYAEGNSNAILEAMRAGLPIVSTRVGGTPIQVGSEGGRFLVPVGDRDALADRLLELIEDEALRLRMGAAMRTRVENVFSIEKVAVIYERAYGLILAGHREQIGLINPDLFKPCESENTLCAE